MKKCFLIAVLIAMLIVPAFTMAAELNNVKAAGEDGSLVFRDVSGNIICAWDPANRKMSFPSGSAFDVESGGYFKIAGTAVTSSATELNKLAGISGDVLTTTNTKTVTNKTFSGPIFTIAATHAYELAEDWVLSAAEMLCSLMVTSSGSGDANIIESGGTAGRIRIIRNGAAGTVTILESGQTGIAIATGKTAVVMHNGTDYIRVTADATH